MIVQELSSFGGGLSYPSALVINTIRQISKQIFITPSHIIFIF